jgi:hypothetical protein
MKVRTKKSSLFSFYLLHISIFFRTFVVTKQKDKGLREIVKKQNYFYLPIVYMKIISYLCRANQLNKIHYGNDKRTETRTFQERNFSKYY